MSEQEAVTVEPVGDREIVLSRTFDAPRKLVYRAYTEPEHIEKWWGPNGFTTTIYEMDVRPVGTWRYMMHGPDGTDYPNLVTYRVVEPPRLLHYDHGDFDDPKQFDVTVSFEEPEPGKTTVTQRMVFPSAEARQTVVDFGAIELGEETMARLGEYLHNM
jgi:uncharacterized protein YndB with AHSA1/START domain